MASLKQEETAIAVVKSNLLTMALLKLNTWISVTKISLGMQMQMKTTSPFFIKKE